MTKQEVLDFMHKIKANYQEFSIEDYVINEWYEKLKQFELSDVLERLDKHLNGEYQKKLPRLNYFINGLKTPEEKAKTNTIRIRCSYCNKVINLDELDSHTARHNSIAYIKSREKLLNKSFNEEKMLNATEKEFDKFYYKFIIELYCVLPDELEEKNRLEIILANYRKEINEWDKKKGED